MRLIIRNLFGERTKKYKEIRTKDRFSDDILVKILLLMNKYDTYSNLNRVVPSFLERLSYLIPAGIIKNYNNLGQIGVYLSNSTMSEFFSVIELYSNTLFEIASQSSYRNYYEFIEDFNGLLAYNKIGFRLVFDEKTRKTYVEPVFSEKEEENKEIVYNLIKNDEKINKYFTDSLNFFAKREFKDSIENAYLTLEKYLKSKTGDHQLDALKNFEQFHKKYISKDKGIFSVRLDIIEKLISYIYTIRSEIKSHSDKENFDTNQFLEETARFQLNEVMAYLILLEEMSKQ